MHVHAAITDKLQTFSRLQGARCWGPFGRGSALESSPESDARKAAPSVSTTRGPNGPWMPGLRQAQMDKRKGAIGNV